MSNFSNVFQYGASESNGRSMGYEEQLQQPTGTGPKDKGTGPRETDPRETDPRETDGTDRRETDGTDRRETDGRVPPQRSAEWIDHFTEDRGGGPVTPRFVLLALTIILLGTAAGLVGALVLPKSYGARAEILYSVSQDQRGDPLKQDRQLSTQLVYLKSRAVLGPVAQKQGRQFKDLDEDLSVKVLDNSEVIQVEAHGATKLAAMQTLQAVMDGYLALIGQPTGLSRNLDTQLADAKANTARIQTQVTQLTAAVLAGTATQISLNDARTQLTASLEREKAVQARIDEFKLTGQAGPDAQLLTPPYSLPDAVFPQPLIAAGTGALVGLIVAGGVVAVGARRRTRP